MNSTVAAKTITELKVSAHLMTLDAGLFCVFNSPGAAPPDTMTGLPGVRLSAAPAPAGLSGTVSISSFNPGGWLGGDAGAALVRVSGGPAPVLVTVYQDPKGQHDAPKLQVIRLSDPAPDQSAEAPGQPAAASQPSGRPRKIEVAAHIYGRGDVGGALGEWMGERGSKRWIEGFGLAPDGNVAVSDIEYQAVLGRDWLSPWSEGGQFCGSRGMSLPILGLRVRLRGAAAETHRVALLAAFVDGTEVGPVSDGEPCEAPSLSPLEAFKVVLIPQDAATAGNAAVFAAAPPSAPGAKPPAPAQNSGKRKNAAPATPKRAAPPAKPARNAKSAAPEASPAAAKTLAAKRAPAARRR